MRIQSMFRAIISASVPDFAEAAAHEEFQFFHYHFPWQGKHLRNALHRPAFRTDTTWSKWRLGPLTPLEFSALRKNPNQAHSDVSVRIGVLGDSIQNRVGM